MSKYQSVKCKRETWSTITEAVHILRDHGYYLKKNEIVDLALRKLVTAIKRMEKR